MSDAKPKLYADGHPPMWPGQADVSEFTLDQVRAIASSSRSMVFWTFSSRTPLSVAEVGKIIGKSAQSVRYHTNELLKVGLLLVADTRRRHARTEEAYVRSSVKLVTKGPPVSPDYDFERRRGFQALWRRFDRDRTAAFQLEDFDISLQVPHHFWMETARLSPEDLRRFRAEATALVEKYVALDREDGIRASLVTLSVPAFNESAQRFKAATGRKLVLRRLKDEDDED
ncbi:MAG: helix-turn-helix transcriptional regulator [Fimbriimonadaceae bacterium]|nr:helix-turn-helix transcriptional regulator [Fimbriimonadaceae bacterium]